MNPCYNPGKPHHTAEGFKNNYGATVTKGMGDCLRWQYERTRDGLPKLPKMLTAVVPPDVAFIQANAKPQAMQPAMTWVWATPPCWCKPMA